MVCITVVDEGIADRNGVHHRPNRCAPPTGSVYITDRMPGPAAGSGVHRRTRRRHRRRDRCALPTWTWCITTRPTGITEPIGVHRRPRWCASPTVTRASQTRIVCITDPNGVHHNQAGVQPIGAPPKLLFNQSLAVYTVAVQ
jgi:hypothetical protein